MSDEERVLPTIIYQEAITMGTLRGTVLRGVYHTRRRSSALEAGEYPFFIVEVKKMDATGGDSWQEIENGELYRYAAAQIAKLFYESSQIRRR